MRNVFAKFTRVQKIIGVAILAILIIAAVVLLLALKPAAYGFDATPKTTKLPAFADNADRVAGWTKDAANPQLADKVPTVNYSNKDGSCKLVTTTAMYPVYLAGRGDLYNSKFALYDSGVQWSQIIKGEGVSKVTTLQNSSLSFATGRYTYTDPASKTKMSAQVAVRAIDKRYKRPASAVGTDQTDVYGLDENYGIPVLSATYTCNAGSGSAAEFASLLQAVHVNLK